MAQQKMAEHDTVESENEWEESLIMLQLPSKINNKNEGESYCQILGLSTEQPMVKIKNQLFAGKLSETLGTHLFLEVDGKPEATQANKSQIKNVTRSDKQMVLEPVYLEPKKVNKAAGKGEASEKQ
ncbi:general transcription factor 3c polypeptide 6-like [Plakobranchus ocellatus]|uniref:General transcription factor 3c polypeptide 6-like n=1 Tax=Plakobranchus ocellatus TaxID=259542 RepID=A0AAV4BJB8_9GAST|nr:general transcription factor 3c polypeptide 6-like [Plakobranchus ocellatus]